MKGQKSPSIGTELDSVRHCSKCFQILTHLMLQTTLNVGTGPLWAVELQGLDLNPGSLTPGSPSLTASYLPLPPHVEQLVRNILGLQEGLKTNFKSYLCHTFLPSTFQKLHKQRKRVLDKSGLRFLLAARPQVPCEHSSRVSPWLSVK